jgi:hypothetical protein
MTQAAGQCKMATRKNREFKTGARPKERKSKSADDYAFPSEQERLPLHIPGTYQVAMGTGEEIVAWFREVPRNTQAILITFSNDESYRMYGPILWHVAHKLPVMGARIQRRRFERLVDALTQLLLAQPRAVSEVVSGAKGAPAKGALPRRRRGHAE